MSLTFQNTEEVLKSTFSSDLLKTKYVEKYINEMFFMF